MELFYGYLFSKLQFIGTRSEGPAYYLQQWDYSEVLVYKKAHPWLPDPTLHKFLNEKVTIVGKLGHEGIHYYDIFEYKPKDFRIKTAAEEEYKLILDLELGFGTVLNIIENTPPTGIQHIDLKLSVEWPYRSIWMGTCPTTQIYDFFMERDGKVVIYWSSDKLFADIVTPVEIPGGSPEIFPVGWDFFVDRIKEEGPYTMRAVFIASGQEITKDFQIKFISG